MSALKSKLVIANQEHGFVSHPPEKQSRPIYRYFKTMEDCQNFAQGDVWLSSANNNRIKNAGWEEDNYEEHTRLFHYKLSFTSWSPDQIDDFQGMRNPYHNDEYVACIVIPDPYSLFYRICNSINQRSQHTISWLDIESFPSERKERFIQEFCRAPTEISSIPEKISISITSLVFSRMEYHPNKRVKSLSHEAIRRTTMLPRSKYGNEDELCIHLNTSSLNYINNEEGKQTQPFERLVEYIKLDCCDLSDCCTIHEL